MSCLRFVRARTTPAANAPTIGAEPAFSAAQATNSAKDDGGRDEHPADVDLPDDADEPFLPRGKPSATMPRRGIRSRDAAERKAHRARKPARLRRSCVTIASTTSPSTSSTTAAPRMIWPSGVFSTPSSERTRAVIPIDVAVSAAPTKIAVSDGCPSAASSAYPPANGSTIPARATASAGPPTRRSSLEIRFEAHFEEEQDHADLREQEDALRERHQPQDRGARARCPRAARRAPPAGQRAPRAPRRAWPRPARTRTREGKRRGRSRAPCAHPSPSGSGCADASRAALAAKRSPGGRSAGRRGGRDCHDSDDPPDRRARRQRRFRPGGNAFRARVGHARPEDRFYRWMQPRFAYAPRTADLSASRTSESFLVEIAVAAAKFFSPAPPLRCPLSRSAARRAPPRGARNARPRGRLSSPPRPRRRPQSFSSSSSPILGYLAPFQSLYSQTASLLFLLLTAATVALAIGRGRLAGRVDAGLLPRGRPLRLFQASGERPGDPSRAPRRAPRLARHATRPRRRGPSRGPADRSRVALLPQRRSVLGMADPLQRALSGSAPGLAGAPARSRGDRSRSLARAIRRSQRLGSRIASQFPEVREFLEPRSGKTSPRMLYLRHPKRLAARIVEAAQSSYLLRPRGLGNFARESGAPALARAHGTWSASRLRFSGLVWPDGALRRYARGVRDHLPPRRPAGEAVARSARGSGRDGSGSLPRRRLR